jgi:hypothetical protein
MMQPFPPPVCLCAGFDLPFRSSLTPRQNLLGTQVERAIKVCPKPLQTSEINKSLNWTNSFRSCKKSRGKYIMILESLHSSIDLYFICFIMRTLYLLNY